jgi:hypothetical protein
MDGALSCSADDFTPWDCGARTVTRPKGAHRGDGERAHVCDVCISLCLAMRNIASAMTDLGKDGRQNVVIAAGGHGGYQSQRK